MLLKNHSVDAIGFHDKWRIWLPLYKYRREADLDQIAAKSKPIACYLSFSELRYAWYLFQASNEKFSWISPVMGGIFSQACTN